MPVIDSFAKEQELLFVVAFADFVENPFELISWFLILLIFPFVNIIYSKFYVVFLALAICLS